MNQHKLGWLDRILVVFVLAGYAVIGTGLAVAIALAIVWMVNKTA